jgi:glucose/arabinose dehydrogenase
LYTQSECGLLGIAFDPKFASNRYVYLHYNTGPDPIKTKIVRYTVSSDGAAFTNEFQIFSFEQLTPSHKGGSINFGPDGFLYIATGDGASPEDIANNAQSPQTFLGKVLRLDVSGDDFPTDADQNYAIPRSNPYYTSKTIKPEIWAVGLRNPFRWSFDSKTGAMIIADVGQDKWEELNYLPKGLAQMNLGWRVKEGDEDFFTNLPAFSNAFTYPFFQYNHSFGRAIVGGFVYRGNALDPSMKGRYVFADATIPKIASISITLSGGIPLPISASSAIVHSPSINTSLGADSISAPVSVTPDINGEIMIADLYKGLIIRLVPPPPTP